MTPVPVHVEVPVVEKEKLTAEDRCDRCGAQAYAKTTHQNGDLRWCQHHYRQHQDKLAEALTVDEINRLAIDEATRLT